MSPGEGEEDDEVYVDQPRLVKKSVCLPYLIYFWLPFNKFSELIKTSISDLT